MFVTFLFFDYIYMVFTVNNGNINQHTRVCRQKLGNFLIVDKNSCGFSDSIPADVSITAVTTTIIKSVCTYTVLTTDFTTCCRTYTSNITMCEVLKVPVLPCCVCSTRRWKTGLLVLMLNTNDRHLSTFVLRTYLVLFNYNFAAIWCNVNFAISACLLSGSSFRNIKVGCQHDRFSQSVRKFYVLRLEFWSENVPFLND
jgi:hypothetical protein